MRAGAVWAVLAAAILTAGAAQAQDGAIVGRVLDAGGEPLPGTTIEAVGPALTAPRVEVTDRQGGYRVDKPAAGPYTVTFNLPGFGSVVRDDIVVGAGLASRVDAELDYGAADDVPMVVYGPSGSGGAIALACTFLPGGAIVDCRRVEVSGQRVPRFR